MIGKRVVLIDLSSLYWTAYHATADQPTSEASKLTQTAVRRCFTDGDIVAVCCDSGRSFRKDMLPEYKANRPEHGHASLGELDRLKDRLRADGFLLWEVKGFEADDVIATACYAATSLGHDVLVASADKDLLQLCGPTVRALRTHNWKEVGEAETVEKFGVDVAQLGDWLALVGDASDNIKGCPGVGPKTATTLLKKYGHLTALFAAVENFTVGEFTPALYKNLRDNMAAVELARKLVALRQDVPFDFREIYTERKVQPLTTKDWSAMSDDEMFGDPAISPPPPKESADPKAEPAQSATAPAPSVFGGEPPAQPAHVKPATEPVTSESVALVPVEYERQLEPTSMGRAYALANYLFESRLYSKLQNAESILAIIIRGREMGVGALTALDCFEIVEGRPFPKAHFVIDRAMRDPACQYLMLIESTAETCTYETKHRDHPAPTRHTYTLEMAKLAGLVKPGRSGEPNQWMKRPAELVRKTCGVQISRIVYPGSSLGLTSYEEMHDQD